MDEFKKFIYYKGEKTVPAHLSRKQRKIWKKEEAKYLADNSKIIKESPVAVVSENVTEPAKAESPKTEAAKPATEVKTVTGIVVDNGKTANPQQEIINKMVDKTPPARKYEENYERIFGKKQLPPPNSPIEPLKPETKMEEKSEPAQQSKQEEDEYKFFLGRINREKKTCELLVYRQPDQASFIHPIFTERGAKYAIKQLSEVKDYQGLEMIAKNIVDRESLKNNKVIYFEVKDVHNWLLDRMVKTEA